MIVYCCADLIFATKVRSTAEAVGVVTRPVRDAAMLQARLDQVDDGKPNGPVDALLVDLDTGETGLELIGLARRHGTPPRIIAFGSHVATDVLQAARERGADAVLPRSAFTARLPQILQQPASV